MSKSSLVSGLSEASGVRFPCRVDVSQEKLRLRMMARLCKMASAFLGDFDPGESDSSFDTRIWAK